MPPFYIDYLPGTYEQSDLERRKRLRDDDVRTFITYWMQGRNPAWIGANLLSLTGDPLSAKMVRSHAQRLEGEFIPAPNGYIQPNWRDWKRPKGEAVGVGVVSADPRAAHRVKVEGMTGGAVRVNRGGRPRKDDTFTITAAPDPDAGLNWREKHERRLAREEAERQAVREGSKDDAAEG